MHNRPLLVRKRPDGVGQHRRRGTHACDKDRASSCAHTATSLCLPLSVAGAAEAANGATGRMRMVLLELTDVYYSIIKCLNFGDAALGLGQSHS